MVILLAVVMANTTLGRLIRSRQSNGGHNPSLQNQKQKGARAAARCGRGAHGWRERFWLGFQVCGSAIVPADKSIPVIKTLFW